MAAMLGSEPTTADNGTGNAPPDRTNMYKADAGTWISLLGSGSTASKTLAAYFRRVSHPPILQRLEGFIPSSGLSFTNFESPGLWLTCGLNPVVEPTFPSHPEGYFNASFVCGFICAPNGR